MPIPLDKLIDKKGNVYEMTCVAIKEANIIASLPEKDEIEEKEEKIVSYVLEQVLNGEIKYSKAEE